MLDAITCDHSKFHYAKCETVNGRYQTRKVCDRCLIPFGPVEKTIAQVYAAYSKNEIDARQKQYRHIHWNNPDVERQRIRDEAIVKAVFDKAYNLYLQSSEWTVARTNVLRRANGKCEGCGKNPAQQVHHLTYSHVGREFLWELVAICRECHLRLHGHTE